MSNHEIGAVWDEGFWCKIKRCKNNRVWCFWRWACFFTESYSEEKYKELGIDFNFVQDNHSLSVEVSVVRGLYFQEAMLQKQSLLE